MRSRIIFIMAFIISFSSLQGKTIWVNKNNFASAGNLNVGDIIVVNVLDISAMQFTINLKNTVTSSLSSSPDLTITGFLPKVNGTKAMKSDDTTQFGEKGKFNFTIAAQLQNRTPDGKFTVAGTRVYAINGAASTVTVTGLVDPVLVKGRNVDSDKVANFRIEIRSTREGLRLQRPALKEGENAQVSLTEAEKQRLIIDYLEKMINELTR